MGFSPRCLDQGPGLFALTAGKLTVVIADQDIQQPVARAGGGAVKAGMAQPPVRQQLSTSGTAAPAARAPASAASKMGRYER